jgi:hypothetical protein
MNKLEPIAELIKNMLEEKFNIEAKYSFEGKKDWLLNVPNRNLYNEFWDDISYTYSKLLDNKIGLDEQLSLINDNKLKAKARIDIWFQEPYNFICEFDETQHFNQFRQMTLENSYKSFDYSFDYQYYIDICKSKILKVGTSGFYKLRSEDLLFPKMYPGEKQDNRLRQRAFRDFLKDIVPVKLGYNPTIRINYKVTNGKIKGFTNDDLKSVENYLIKNNILGNIKIK